MAEPRVQRPRRDPRRRFEGSVGPHGRRRLRLVAPLTEADLTSPSAVEAPDVAVLQATEPAPLKAQRTAATDIAVDDAPAYYIVAVPDLVGGRVSLHDRLVLDTARGLANEAGGSVLAVIFEPSHDSLGDAGADRVMTFQGQVFDGYAPEARSEAILAIIEKTAARHVVLPDSAAGGADLGRRVAASLGDRAAGDAWRVSLEKTTRLAATRAFDITLETPRVVLLDADATPANDTKAHEAKEISPLSLSIKPQLRDLGPIAVEPGAVALGEAALVLAGGRGLGDWRDLTTVASRLGATLAGSRGAADRGMVERNRQIGGSGRCEVEGTYVAFGISGSPQHLRAIGDQAKVVAVNVDPTCPLMQRADLAVVGEAEGILRALVQLLNAEDPDA